MSVCYRPEITRQYGSKQFRCFADVIQSNGEGQNLRKQAADIVAALRKEGRKAFFEKIEGTRFYRIFVRVYEPEPITKS